MSLWCMPKYGLFSGCLPSSALYITSAAGDLGEILVSTLVPDVLEEALTHTEGFAAVESFRVAVFSHIHPVQAAIGVQTHNNPVFVTVRNRIIAAVICPDVTWELFCSWTI